MCFLAMVYKDICPPVWLLLAALGKTRKWSSRRRRMNTLRARHMTLSRVPWRVCLRRIRPATSLTGELPVCVWRSQLWGSGGRQTWLRCTNLPTFSARKLFHCRLNCQLRSADYVSQLHQPKVMSIDLHARIQKISKLSLVNEWKSTSRRERVS